MNRTMENPLIHFNKIWNRDWNWKASGERENTINSKLHFQMAFRSKHKRSIVRLINGECRTRKTEEIKNQLKMCLQKLKDKLFMSDSNRRSSHEAVRLEINLPTGSQTFYSTLIINKKLSTIAIYFYVPETNNHYGFISQFIFVPLSAPHGKPETPGRVNINGTWKNTFIK